MKQALVTGGIKGIGLAVTKMLLSEGYAVTATYAHDEEAAQNGVVLSRQGRFSDWDEDEE